jgi:hypothetical protein
MPKYRKKPVTIEAVQWFKNGDHPKVIQYIRYLGSLGVEYCLKCNRSLKDHGWVDTLEGGHIVCPGDWIITGIKGEMYPCKPDIFSATYDAVSEEK